VRRDLQRLETEGRLDRVFGGAKLPAETSFAPRARARVQQKRRIAARAAALARPGETIALETGTTVLAVAAALQAPNLAIVTNSIDVLATQLRSDLRVVITGGAFDPNIRSLHGPLVERFYADHHVDRLFIGAGSMDETGLRDSNLEALEAKRAAIRASRETVVVADSAKFELNALALVAPWSDITTFVTDAEAPEAALQAIAAQGVEVLVA
jgi:DeoR/GlpR family transcriptional regulator of sugar metabolism